MGSNWIEVGSALINKHLIVAVGEVHYNKYDETWEFHVHFQDGNRYNSVEISGKNEIYVKKEHDSLKDTLRNS
ncbi:MAG: hypothetical protein V3S69_03440 [Dehalococcoidales bacterium]